MPKTAFWHSRCGGAASGLLATLTPMWRRAVEADDGEVIRFCLALNDEDPGPAPVLAAQVERSLRTFRLEPHRGMAVVLDIDETVVGYALLTSFWSNELGGEVCLIDELYVAPDSRGRGHATALLDQLAALWGRPFVAASLEVSATNEDAMRLYRRAGFMGTNVVLVRRSLGDELDGQIQLDVVTQHERRNL